MKKCILRDDITITYPDGSQKYFPKYTKLSVIIEGQEGFIDEKLPLLACLVNRESLSLAESISDV